MRKKSNALLAILLTGAMTVTSISPAFAAEDFSADAEVQAVQDVVEEESDDNVSDVQDQSDLGEAEDVEDVFTSGEEPSDPDTVDACFGLTDGNTAEYVQDDLLLADSSEEKYQDGTYTPESFTFQGGSGKVTITCPKVTITRGKVTATVVFSSSSYNKLVVDGEEYFPVSGTEYTGSVFQVPAVLNQDMEITGTTVAMTTAHDITYTIHIKLNVPMVTPAPDRLEDGTYQATVKADSGFPAEACTLLVKDGEIDAVVTLKNGDYDRLYVGDALDAVNEKDDKLIAYRPSEDGTKHIFWPLAVDKLDTLFQVAARKTDKTWTDHYVKILSSSVTKVSDEVQAPDQAAEAAKFLYRNYVDDVISTTGGVTKDGSTYHVAYYNSYKSAVSGISLKRPSVKEYKSGWFFSDWSIFKSTVKQQPAKSQTYNLDTSKRTQEQQVTATLKLYDPSVEDAAINDNSAQPLAEYTYKLVLAAKPDTCQVTFRAVNSKTGEVIPEAQITVTNNTTKEEVTGTEGIYQLKSGQKYTVQAQSKGYIAAGTKGDAVAKQTSFTAAFDETVDLSLTAEADSKHNVTFKIVDAEGKEVPDAVLTVTGETPAEDGSYTLWDNCTYFYRVTAEGYQVVRSKFIKPLEDQEVVVTLTALKNYQASIKIRAKSGHLEVVNPKVLSVTYKKNGETFTVEPSEDGTYPMVETVAYTYTFAADNYQSATANWTASGTEGPVELEGVLSKETAKALLEDTIATAKELSDEMTEGDGAGQWAAGSKETLNAAIQAAEEVYAKENAADDDYKTAKDALQSVVSGLSQKENAESINITVFVNKNPGEAPVKMAMNVTADDAAKVTPTDSKKKDNYNKSSDMEKRATVIDALVDLHKELFGEEYIANPTQYLMCGSRGAGTGFLLGQKSFKNFVGFRVNGKYVASDPRMCRLKEGDVLSVFSATTVANPAYLQFEQQETTVNQNEEFTLTLTGDSYYMDEDINRTVGKNEFTPAEGYDITLVNAETGEEVTGEAKTDAQGKVSFKIGTPGIYVVKTVTNENVESIVLPYAQIQVKEKAPVILENGTYLVKVINNNKMFNVINNSCVLKVENGKMTAEISLHGKGYDYMYAGTKEEAEAAGEAAWAHYYEKEIAVDNGDKVEMGPWYTYSLAVSALDQEIAFSSHNTRDGKWFDRKLTFLTEGIQKINTPQPTPTVTPTPTVEPTAAPQPTAVPQPTEAPKSVTVAAKKLTVNTSTMYLKVKKSDTIGVIVAPSNTTDKVTYKSSKKSVATVDKNGKVTAKKAGKAVITVKAGKLTKKVTVVVGKYAKKVTKLKFAKKSMTLKKGSMQFLKVTVKPKKATTDLKWKSSNTKVVTVDKNGKVTAKKAGTAWITVRGNGKKASIKIKVKSK